MSTHNPGGKMHRGFIEDLLQKPSWEASISNRITESTANMEPAPASKMSQLRSQTQLKEKEQQQHKVNGTTAEIGKFLNPFININVSRRAE